MSADGTLTSDELRYRHHRRGRLGQQKMAQQTCETDWDEILGTDIAITDLDYSVSDLTSWHGQPTSMEHASMKWTLIEADEEQR